MSMPTKLLADWESSGKYVINECEVWVITGIESDKFPLMLLPVLFARITHLADEIIFSTVEESFYFLIVKINFLY